MAMFPKIDSPCPYKANLAAVMDGDFCRMCKRSVIDLNAMDDAGRAAFLKSCSGEVCVSYSLKPALAAAAMAAAVMALPAAAQDAPPAPTTASADATADTGMGDDEQYEEIIVGGIKDPKNTSLTEEAADAAIPELPVIVETADKPAAR